jgi:endonuclease YncB( thermonuclease family)
MKETKYIVSLFVLMLLAILRAANCYAAAELDGYIVGVTDGDTVNLMVSGNRTVEIRLDNIDAPETSCHQWKPSRYESACVEHEQPFGKTSKEYLARRIYDKFVRVLLPEEGFVSYNRLIGTIYLDGQDINYEMVSNGLAWHYTQYARKHQTREEYRKYEIALQEAQKNSVGLWADKSAIPPWIYRHQIEGK